MLIRRIAVTLLLLAPGQAWCWGDQGHQIVARIAAAHLTAAAREAVARLLRQDADLQWNMPAERVADAMARGAIWPDHMTGGKGATAAWHYINIGLFEGPAHMRARCPNGDCIVARMNRCLADLKQRRGGGVWPEYKELEFLLHFAGDIHQPLHCATDADAGGNCVRVAGFDPLQNLHAIWDIALVRALAAHDGSGMLAGMESRFRGRLREWQNYGSVEKIAAESFQLARSQVYGKARPRIPVIATFIEVQPRACATEAPKEVRRVLVDGLRSYGGRSLDVVRMQLYRGGVRLAAMLNAIYGE
jgi:hypothetical protein